MQDQDNIVNLENKHILGLDYGRKFTGIGTYKYKNDPFPLMWGRIPYKSDQQLIESIQQIIDDEFIDIIILGVPYFTDGSESKMTKEIKAFGLILEEKTQIKVLTVDETLTTYEAEERMKNSPQYNFKVDYNKIDALCATIIIDEFIKNNSI